MADQNASLGSFSFRHTFAGCYYNGDTTSEDSRVWILFQEKFETTNFETIVFFIQLCHGGLVVRLPDTYAVAIACAIAI